MSVIIEPATGAAAIATTIAPNRRFQLLEIRLHLSAVGGAVGNVNFTATLDAIEGTPYDILIFTNDMTADADVIYQPTYPQIFEEGDEIDFAYVNGSSKTYGLTVIYNPL